MAIPPLLTLDPNPNPPNPKLQLPNPAYMNTGSKLPDIGSLTLITRLYLVSLLVNLSLTLVSVGICLICMLYAYALYVCLICMPYMYALYACLIWLPYTYALHVCLI